MANVKVIERVVAMEFRALTVGEWFFESGFEVLYIKINNKDVMNAIRISDGSVCSFENEDSITYIPSGEVFISVYR